MLQEEFLPWKINHPIDPKLLLFPNLKLNKKNKLSWIRNKDKENQNNKVQNQPNKKLKSNLLHRLPQELYFLLPANKLKKCRQKLLFLLLQFSQTKLQRKANKFLSFKRNKNQSQFPNPHRIQNYSKKLGFIMNLINVLEYQLLKRIWAVKI